MNKPPKGFVFKTNNTSVWNSTGIRFTSYVRSQTSRSTEQWFTDDHHHNLGAVKSSLKFIFPKFIMKFDYEENLLMNPNNKLIEENGIDYVEIDVS